MAMLNVSNHGETGIGLPENFRTAKNTLNKRLTKIAVYPITIKVFSTGCHAESGDAPVESRRSTNRIQAVTRKARLKKNAILEKRRNWIYELRFTSYELRIKKRALPQW